ncbi:MAG TPA: glycosyltransferase, partial [Terracidiphilus sp.]
VIGAAVKSLPPDSVIVVDDHSHDGTAEEAREAGAGVLEAPPVAAGALGKASACMAGARLLTSRWILFTDADTRYQAGFLESAVRYAEAHGLTLLSVHLTTRAESWAQRILDPYASALFFSGASPRRDPAAMFNGQCILARRDAYEFLGGHAAVLRDLAEDVKLAKLAQRHRMDFGAARSGGLGQIHKRDGWKDVRSAIGRNTCRLIHVNPRTSFTLLITALCAALCFPVAAWLWFVGHRVAPVALVLALLLELYPWYRNPLRVLLAPIAIYTALPVLIRGSIGALAGRPIEWKGRTVRIT